MAAEILQKYSEEKTGGSNEQHFDLLLLAEIIKRNELAATEDLVTSLSKIDEFLHCSVLKVEIIKMQTFLQSRTGQSFTTFLHSQYTVEPGYHQWKKLTVQHTESSATEFETFEEAEARVEAIGRSADNIEAAIELATRILDHRDSSICSGHLLEKILDFFLTDAVTEALNPAVNNQLFNSETALEILDILEHQKLKSKSFGSSVEDKVTLLAARCLNIMLIQDDWEWFFGDSSEYVSKLVENSENILALAAPENIETSRMAAALAVAAFLPFFKLCRVQRKVLILQFGFVNLLNAGLLLLQDEDSDVRELAIKFSSELPRWETINYFLEIKHHDCQPQAGLELPVPQCVSGGQPQGGGLVRPGPAEGGGGDVLPPPGLPHPPLPAPPHQPAGPGQH